MNNAELCELWSLNSPTQDNEKVWCTRFKRNMRSEIKSHLVNDTDALKRKCNHLDKIVNVIHGIVSSVVKGMMPNTVSPEFEGPVQEKHARLNNSNMKYQLNLRECFFKNFINLMAITFTASLWDGETGDETMVDDNEKLLNEAKSLLNQKLGVWMVPDWNDIDTNNKTLKELIGELKICVAKITEVFQHEETSNEIDGEMYNCPLELLHALQAELLRTDLRSLKKEFDMEVIRMRRIESVFESLQRVLSNF